MAENIDRDLRIKVASEALRSHLSALARIIHPPMVALDLFSKKVIDRSVLDKTRLEGTKYDKAVDVLTAVSDALMTNPDVFDIFCEVIETEPTTADLARLLKDDHTKLLRESCAVEQSTKCLCNKLQQSFLSKLRKRLDAFKDFSYSDQKNAVQTAIKEYITCFIQAGCSSTDHLNEHLLLLHENENLITDPTMYFWAKQLVEEKYIEIAATVPQSQNEVSSAPTPPLFSKAVLYHASICTLAVNSTNAGEYQKFFKTKQFVPGHSLKEVSISCSKQDRYLLAIQDDSIYYIAFQSEPDIKDWPEKYKSFENGIIIQTERFPIDYITELLNNDKNRVVLTGFAFGGMLACSIAVQVWQRGYIPAQLLQENLTCITFAQPHLPVPQLAELARDRPEIKGTVHAIYYEEDIVPRLVRLLDLPCSTLGVKKELGLQMKVKEPPKPAFKDSTTQSLISTVGMLMKDEKELIQPIADFSEQLKGLLNRMSRNPGLSQPMTYYQLSYSTGPSSCLQFSEMTNDQIATQCSYLKPDEIHHTILKLSRKHSMDIYCDKVFCGFLDKHPAYQIPTPDGKAVAPMQKMRPLVSSIAIHEHGNELALVLEGANFWFCNRLSICRENIDTPASEISGNSIKLNFDKKSKPSLGLLSNEQEILVKVFNHFMKSPSSEKLKVIKKEYPVSVRQRQLARLTPSQLIEVTYLSALLEQHPFTGPQPLSHKVTVIKEFLEKVVEVVPLESVGYAIAYGSDYIAQQCVKVLDACFKDMPLSLLMSDCFRKAAGRVNSGMSSEIHGELLHPALDKLDFHDRFSEHLYHFDYDFNLEDKTLEVKVWFPGTTSIDAPAATHTYSLLDLERKYNIEPNKDLFQLSHTTNFFDLQTKLLVAVTQKPARVNNVICGLSISSLYGLSSSQLRFPIDMLEIGKRKLASLIETSSSDNSSTSVRGFQVSPRVSTSATSSSLNNKLMLKTVNDIRTKDLAICSSLLAGFMEQHEVVIPLIKSQRDHSKALALSARASVGVWALSSLDFEHIQPILKQCRGQQLLVKIEDYIKGIVEAKAMAPSPDDTQYAAKLQFIVQGAEKTVTCNSQYISYSLERQLADLCEKRNITETIALDKLSSLWDQLFERNILSLVAKSHRPLIARWLKWALMVHNLREELAKYTAVGVVGLVNSGKSKLINSLFGIQIPSGTTEERRTTVPFTYNLEDKVDGLDVVDFPGVDDRDESISGLADLLLTLAQIIIFVVDYRKHHTESSKKWLERLQVEKVPVLVCLTFADKLYAEHMTKDGKHPDKRYMKQRLQEQLKMIKEKLDLPTSHQIQFCSFSQDNDSVLNCDEGRQRLRDVGISTPLEVGDWLVDTFRWRFGQDELADRLRDFVHLS